MWTKKEEGQSELLQREIPYPDIMPVKIRQKCHVHLCKYTRFLKRPTVVKNIYVRKHLWYWHKNRHIHQWNRTESPEINLCLCSQLIFDIGDRSIKWSKISLFNKWCWEICTATCKKKRNSTSNLHHTQMKDLNISSDT